jgi:hypothetical protein
MGALASALVIASGCTSAAVDGSTDTGAGSSAVSSNSSVTSNAGGGSSAVSSSSVTSNASGGSSAVSSSSVTSNGARSTASCVVSSNGQTESIEASGPQATAFCQNEVNSGAFHVTGLAEGPVVCTFAVGGVTLTVRSEAAGVPAARTLCAQLQRQVPR